MTEAPAAPGSAQQGAPAAPASTAVVTAKPEPRQTIIVSSEVPVLDTGMFEQMQRVARIMAHSNMLPEHLVKYKDRNTLMTQEEAFANCFLVVNQAVRWRMDPFGLAQHVFIERGRIGYEGKLVAAVINTHPMVESRLSYSYSGDGPARKITVTGKLKGDANPLTVEGTFADWHTVDKEGHVKDSWRKGPDQMLSYRGAREWARRHLPEAMLGVHTEDELDQIALPRDLTSPLAEGARGAAAHLRTLVGAEPGAEHPPATAAGAPAAPPAPAEGKAEAPAAAAETAKAQPAKAEPEPERQAEAEPKQPQKAEGKPKGSPKILREFLQQLSKAPNSNELGAFFEDHKLYSWQEGEAKQISEAYEKRRAELKDKGK